MGESRFLLVNIAVVILLLILFLRIKKKAKPSSLRFETFKLPESLPTAGGERSLNCLFNYNGHTWDAHEILGIPAGCEPQEVKDGYERALKRAQDEQSRAIITAAFDALKQQGQIR